MISRSALRKFASKLVDGLTLMAFGAWNTIGYLEWAHPQIAKVISSDASDFQFAFFTLLFVGNWLRPRPIGRSDDSDLQPKWSGTMVVVAVGVAAIVSVYRSDLANRPLVMAVLAFVTVVVAGLVWRFASRHGGEIGEARFDTGR